MSRFPLKYLQLYMVKESSGSLQKGAQLRYLETTSNIHDMMELVRFVDVHSGDQLVWAVRTEELYENWQLYLEEIQAVNH